ncbi:hypothetical protein SAY86_022777 [Trapa natans]|uniref:Uncharacterized protein n=1 Tax=Trapa natans TaxID=22666 RepID=A0AAN7LU04_TRANT|nr:hypothetical protein SAY86_022777 [Trapa natans]
MSAYHPDDVCWGIHLLDDCSITNAGSCNTIAQYASDPSHVEYVRKSYVDAESAENDEMIALFFQKNYLQLLSMILQKSLHLELIIQMPLSLQRIG